MLITYTMPLLFCLTNGYNLNEALINSDTFRKYLNQIKVFLNEDGVSYYCKQQFEFYNAALIQNQSWALRMFDAGGKLPSGLLNGLTYEFGTFDECLNVDWATDSAAVKITGKYCLAEVPLNDNNQNATTSQILSDPQKFLLAICAPNGCSAGELQTFYQGIVEGIELEEESCQTQETRSVLSAGTIASICFFSIFLGIVIISTLYEIIERLYLKNGRALLVSFSVLTNWQKLFAISKDSKQITCLHGLRTISTMWIVFGHTTHYVPVDQSFLKGLFRDSVTQYNISKAKYDLAVDTFFLMSGLVTSYVYMVSSFRGKKLNVMLHYFHRYLRLTSILVIQIIIDMHLAPHFANGPKWEQTIGRSAQDCKKLWWIYLFYLQNYVTEHKCMVHTWYLAVDMQLYLLSPILLIPLLKWPKLGKVLIGFLTIASITLCFYNAYDYDLQISPKTSAEFDAFYTKYYFQAYTRASPWLIGILLGYFIYHENKKRHFFLNNVLICILWIIAIVTLYVCAYGQAFLPTRHSLLRRVFYLGLARPAWAIATSWVILACALGYGGLLNWFLSLPVFQIVGKLTYSIYIVHLTIVVAAVAQMRVIPYATTFWQMQQFWGNFMFSLAVAGVFYLCLELPIVTIESYIFNSKKKPKDK